MRGKAAKKLAFRNVMRSARYMQKVHKLKTGDAVQILLEPGCGRDLYKAAKKDAKK